MVYSNWRSKVYVNKVLKTISGEYFKNYKINKVQRSKSGVRLYYGSLNEYFDYDKVIFATHADEALKLIQSLTTNEKKILSSFKYRINAAYLHKDHRFMPENKNAWSSWNSILEKEDVSKNCSLVCIDRELPTINKTPDIPNKIEIKVGELTVFFLKK